MDFADFQTRLERCRDLLEEERFEEALDLAGDLVTENPGDPDAIAVYCDACLALGRATDAIRRAQKFLRRHGDDLAVLELLARAQWDVHLVERCRETCRRILAIEPGNYTALDYGLAATLELGNLEEGRDIVEQATAHHEGDPHLRFQTAVARMMDGPDPWALDTFKECLARDPDDPAAYINLMRIRHLAGEYGEVGRIYHRARNRGIEHEDMEFNLGLALKARDQDREAIRHFLRAVRMNPSLPDAHFHIGQILRNEGHPRLALRILERELGIDDTHPAVHAEMAWCSEDLGDYSVALGMMQAAIERAKEWAVYRHSAAELAMKAGLDAEEVEEIARSAVELDDSFAAGWQVTGRLAAERGDFEAARFRLEKAVAAADATAEDRGWLGLVLLELGDGSEALPHLEAAARIHPGWRAVVKGIETLRGRPLPNRYEVRISARDERDRPRYRVVHVVASSEADARRRVQGTGRRESVEILSLGCEVDREPGIVWDSGLTDLRHPVPPPPS